MNTFVDLSGQIAVVTGSSRGIGRAIVEELARAGARVAVTGRTLELPQQVAASIVEAGGAAAAFAVDVANAASVEALVAAVLERFGKVDILVNSAGISPMYTRALKIEEKDWDAVVATNLKGTFLCCQKFGQVMIEEVQRCKEAGMPPPPKCVVNISSVAARSASPRLAAYAATKGGVEALTRTLAIEWAEDGVRVNAVAPAFVETDMNLGLRTKMPELAQQLINHTPLRCFGQPQDVAGMVVFLCSDRARYITGTVIDVDGGWLAE